MSQSVHSPQYRRFLRLLVKTRESCGLTQVEVAHAIGRPQSFVSKAESGERRLDVVELLQLLSAMGVDPVEFVSALTPSAFEPSRRRRS